MTPMELAMECKRVIEHSNSLRYVTLVVPGPAPRGEYVSLDRARHWRKSPRGYVLNWQDNPPRVVAQFNAIDVLAYLAATGQVDIEPLPAGGPL